MKAAAIAALFILQLVHVVCSNDDSPDIASIQYSSDSDESRPDSSSSTDDAQRLVARDRSSPPCDTLSLSERMDRLACKAKHCSAKSDSFVELVKEALEFSELELRDGKVPSAKVVKISELYKLRRRIGSWRNFETLVRRLRAFRKEGQRFYSCCKETGSESETEEDTRLAKSGRSDNFSVVQIMRHLRSLPEDLPKPAPRELVECSEFDASRIGELKDVLKVVFLGECRPVELLKMRTVSKLWWRVSDFFLDSLLFDDTVKIRDALAAFDDRIYPGIHLRLLVAALERAWLFEGRGEGRRDTRMQDITDALARSVMKRWEISDISRALFLQLRTQRALSSALATEPLRAQYSLIYREVCTQSLEILCEGVVFGLIGAVCTVIIVANISSAIGSSSFEHYFPRYTLLPAIGGLWMILAILKLFRDLALQFS